MTTNFPTSVDSFPDPLATDRLDNPPHDVLHTNVNSAVEAIETALLDGAPLHIDDVNERVGVGTTSPSTELEVDGTVTATEFVGDLQGATHIQVKNTSGGSLSKGTPVYATGSVGASGAVEVQASLAGTASTMPALGLLDETLADNAEGSATILGVVRQVDTSSYSVNDSLYVAVSGGLTDVRPTGASELVQKIGRVVRSDASTGEILVLGAGRSNDVPNGLSPTITLSGDASGSVTLTELSNGTLSVTVNDDSHNHTIANVDNLQSSLDGKAASSHSHSYLPLSGGTITGNVAINGTLTTDSIKNDNGTFLTLEGGDGWNLAGNASGEYVWLAAEGGLMIISSDSNSTSWADREQIRITAEGGIDNRLRVHGQLRTTVTGSYGTIQTANVASWDGFSINGRVVFMHDDANAWGIYNDVNNHWMIYGVLGGAVELKHNNATKAYTDSSGFRVAGRLYSDSGTSSFDVLQVRNEIQLAYGSVTDPPITWSSDGDTGIYGANDRVYIGTSGVMRAAFGNNFCDFYGESRFYYDTTSNDWSAQPIQAVAGTANDIGIAIRSYGSDTHTTQMRAASGRLYIRSHNDGAYHTVYAIISNQSSRDEKQDIIEWSPPVPVSAGSMTNPEYATTMSLVNQLNVVSYRWEKERYCIANEVCEDDPDHDDTHICGRDCDSSVDDPCNYYKQWERGTIGLVAEEVGEVIPQVTDIDMESGENKAIDGLALTAVLVKALQEIDARLSALEAA